MAAYGPQGAENWWARQADGLHPAGPPTRTSPAGPSARSGMPRLPRAGPRTRVTMCVAAPAYVGTDPGASTEPVALVSVAWSATTWADLVARYGTSGPVAPWQLTDYIEGRAGYDYSHHGPGRQTRRPTSCRMPSWTGSAWSVPSRCTSSGCGKLASLGCPAVRGLPDARPTGGKNPGGVRPTTVIPGGGLSLFAGPAVDGLAEQVEVAAVAGGSPRSGG